LKLCGGHVESLDRHADLSLIIEALRGRILQIFEWFQLVWASVHRKPCWLARVSHVKYQLVAIFAISLL
jgi:hypothetical protein